MLEVSTVHQGALLTSFSSECQDTDSVAVNWTGGSCTLFSTFINNSLTLYKNSAVLYFQLEWSYEPDNTRHKRDSNIMYSYSPPWAVADSSNSVQTLLAREPALRYPDEAFHAEGSTPVAQPNASGAPASPASSSSTGSFSATATGTASSSKNASSTSKGLPTGAIAGIVVGGVVVLVLVAVGVGCLCRRRRRRNRRGADGEHHPHSRQGHTMDDLMAEKEARAIMETAPDTPYSERDSQHAMQLQQLQLQRHSSISLGRLGENRVLADNVGRARDRGSGIIGSAITTTTTIGSAGRRMAGSPTHDHDSDHDSDDNAELEHISMMSSPIHHVSSSQQDERAFTPYTDRPPTDYSQHHRVVDGADLVQQEQSNSHSPPGGVATNIEEKQQQRQQQQQQPPSSPPQQQKQRPSPLSTQGGDSGSTHHTEENNTSEEAPSAHASPEMRPAGFARARSTTPSGISGRYAHLIEDGMTDDEIRRLEEEERALDEAIEQAATTGRTTPR